MAHWLPGTEGIVIVGHIGAQSGVGMRCVHCVIAHLHFLRASDELSPGPWPGLGPPLAVTQQGHSIRMDLWKLQRAGKAQREDH